MRKQTTANTAAVIEIGSYSVQMQISQLKKGEIIPVDYLEYPLNLGHDIFHGKRISYENLRMLSSILARFALTAETYAVSRIQTIASPFFYEAENIHLVLEQIKNLNKIDIVIFEDSEKKTKIYYEAVRSMPDSEHFKGNKDILLAQIGSGSIGLAIYNNDALSYTQNIPMGALRIHDILGSLRAATEDYTYIIDEYIDALFQAENFPQAGTIIFTGSETPLIARLLSLEKKKGLTPVSLRDITDLFRRIRPMTIENIALRFNLLEDEAIILYNALFIYTGILKLFPSVKNFFLSFADLKHVVLSNLLLPKSSQGYQQFIQKSVLLAAETIACKWHYHKEHCEAVSGYAIRIFDKMKPVHGLEPSSQLYLQTASLLCEASPYAGFRNSPDGIFDFVIHLDIPALKRDEITKIALLASSTHSLNENHAYLSLPLNDKITLSKLAAILQISCALDKSMKGKLLNVKILLQEDTLLIKADTAINATLERWAFDSCTDFFKSVFGLSPVLKIKSKML